MKKEDLLKWTKKIKDEELRKKVVQLIKDIKLTNKHFSKYKPQDIETAATYFVVTAPVTLGPIERPVLQHTVFLTELVDKVADFFIEKFGIPLNKDHMIAAAIVHDLMKLFEFNRTETGELEHTGIMLDHTTLAVAELYKRDFPEDVIHIVASHAGESGSTPPRSFEALIFHYLDSLISLVEYYFYGKLQQAISQQLVQKTRFDSLSEKEIKKIFDEQGSKKDLD